MLFLSIIRIGLKPKISTNFLKQLLRTEDKFVNGYFCFELILTFIS